MRTSMAVGLTLLLCSAGIALAGATYADLLGEIVSSLNEMANIMEKAKNAAEAKEPLDKQVQTFAETQAKFLEKKPSKDDETKLKKQFDLPLARATQRFNSAANGLQQRDPKGFKDLEPVFAKMAAKVEKKTEKKEE